MFIYLRPEVPMVSKPEATGSNSVLPVTRCDPLQLLDRMLAGSTVGIRTEHAHYRGVFSGQRPMSLQEGSVVAFEPGRDEDRKRERHAVMTVATCGFV